MFWEVFCELCKERGKAPSAVLTMLGISKGNLAKWREGAMPRGSTLLKLSEYFSVSTSYLLGDENGTEETEKAPAEDLSEGERMVLEAIRGLPEDQRTAAMMECIAVLMQRRQGS